MKRREFIKATGLVTAGTAVSAKYLFGNELLPGSLLMEKKPNIIFILADDYGIGEVSCYGADNYKTPNIDRLAQGGVRFTHSFTPSLCGPSRACILTGRYGFRTGATNQDATGEFSPSAETMMPKILKQSGYVSAAIGKWGQLPLGPAEFGFDEYLKFSGSGIYWNSQKKGKFYEVNGKEFALRDNEYLPDVMHTHAVNFISKHRDEPFYLYYSMSHVHTEILPTPDSVSGSKDLYADNIAYMDKLVGKLVDELDRLKLREKTMIVFFGDNGSTSGRAKDATIGGRRLAGAKGSMEDGGSLEPMIVNWPGVAPAGTVCSDMIDSTDFMPTFAELAGVKLPQDKIIDGRSFASQIRRGIGKPREWAYIQLASMWYVREKEWKLNQKGELYDMSDAPFTEKLVSAETTDPKAISARKRLQAALDQLDPANGIKDDGDGTGRHKNRQKKGNGE